MGSTHSRKYVRAESFENCYLRLSKINYISYITRFDAQFYSQKHHAAGMDDTSKIRNIRIQRSRIRDRINYRSAKRNRYFHNASFRARSCFAKDKKAHQHSPAFEY